LPSPKSWPPRSATSWGLMANGQLQQVQVVGGNSMLGGFQGMSSIGGMMSMMQATPQISNGQSTATTSTTFATTTMPSLAQHCCSTPASTRVTTRGDDRPAAKYHKHTRNSKWKSCEPVPDPARRKPGSDNYQSAAAAAGTHPDLHPDHAGHLSEHCGPATAERNDHHPEQYSDLFSTA